MSQEEKYLRVLYKNNNVWSLHLPLPLPENNFWKVFFYSGDYKSHAGMLGMRPLENFTNFKDAENYFYKTIRELNPHEYTYIKEDVQPHYVEKITGPLNQLPKNEAFIKLEELRLKTQNGCGGCAHSEWAASAKDWHLVTCRQGAKLESQSIADENLSTSLPGLIPFYFCTAQNAGLEGTENG